VSVYAFDEPCDMRKSFDTLTALVVEHMRHDVLAGDVCLLASRDHKRAKRCISTGPGCVCWQNVSRRDSSAQRGNAKSKRGYEMTLSELALFIEGSEVAARVALSPNLLKRSDLRPDVPRCC
jgi:transposase